ncbi:GNAT family N-acetyltransferase [Ensifer sp. LC163]|uniref:GNAT family N-acetyltransferase n=1 Tax=Ensifer sp. LC163 TaxID=1120652 RepID=UPI000812E0DC|nr:GNAT family N-acetyltransferase [Ensifer sp. LC163]OCP17168.1 hypothetical protein BC360_13180 [Ensifer sp. LC163]
MTKNSSTYELIPLENVVLKHANAGIALGAEHRFAESLEQWRLAAQLADANFEGEDLYYWVRGGYGAALHDVGRHRESIAVSKLVREWTLSLRQPLADDGVDCPGVYLWRFMIARPFQGKGVGKKAIELVVRDLKARGIREPHTSYGMGEASPEGFYKGLGFVPTGDSHGEEPEVVLKFAA